MALLSPAEAAKQLGIDVKTLNSWRWRGVGPAFVRFERHVRYDSTDIEAYIAQCRRIPSVQAFMEDRHVNLSKTR